MRACRKALQVPDTVARERDPLGGFDNLLVTFGVLRVPSRWMFILSGKPFEGQGKLLLTIVDLRPCRNAGASS